MSSGTSKRTRSERVATLKLPPGTLKKAWQAFRRSDVLLRIGMCVVAAVAAWGVTGAWVPPLAYRAGDIPARNVIARVSFQRVNEQKTREMQQSMRRTLECVYRHDPDSLEQLQKARNNKIFVIREADSYEDVDRTLWSEFDNGEEDSARVVAAETADAIVALSAAVAANAVSPPLQMGPGYPVTRQWHAHAKFALQAGLRKGPRSAQFTAAVKRSLAEFTERGLLDSPQHGLEEGNQSSIRVYRKGNRGNLRSWKLDDVRIGQIDRRLEANLRRELPSVELAGQIYHWLRPQLPTTLLLDRAMTDRTGRRDDSQSAAGD